MAAPERSGRPDGLDSCDMGLDNPLHIAFLLIILLLVFGAKRLPEIGRSVGTGMREFKDSISGQTPMLSQSTQPPQAPAQPVAAQATPPAEAAAATVAPAPAEPTPQA
jgi:sec-independent protein translocase protein TatA